MSGRYTVPTKKMLAAAIALAAASGFYAYADDAALTGREGQALGEQLSGSMSMPSESGGSFNFGQGITISPSDLAPDGDGLYIQNPNVDGIKGVYDSDHDMDSTGRAAQGKLYQDAQAKGNPFDPDPNKRDQPGPSTVSGAAYQVVLGVSGARDSLPDNAFDDILDKSGSAMLDDSLLESFGDCSVETEVTEGTRPVHIPEEEFCERVIKPAPAACQVKHELEVEEVVTGSGETYHLIVYDLPNAYGGAAVQLERDSDGAGLWLRGHSEAEVSSQDPFAFANEYCPTMGFASVADCKNASVALKEPFTLSGSFYYWWMLKFTATTKKLVIKTDRWYPEECVARAQRG